MVVRLISTLAATAVSLVAAAGLIARVVPVTNHPTLFVAALAPYLTVAAVVAVPLFLLARRRVMAGAAAVLTVAAVAVQLPLFVPAAGPPPGGVPVRVLTANVEEGTADPRALADLARTRADILVLQELTPELTEALTRLGIGADFPHRVTDARPEAAGAGIWSRYPITRSATVPGYRMTQLRAVVDVPGARAETVVLVTHIAGPWPQPIDGWREEMAAMAATMSGLAGSAGQSAVIVAGDFNSTHDMQPFRRLLRGGFADSADQSGSGPIRAWPADRRVPPLIGIDHILTYQATATGAHTVRVPGSDHLGLTATVHLPGG